MKYGEYGRTKNGYIDKYVNIEGETYKRIVRDNKITELRWYVEDCGGIVNHSKDPKDLVQVGDFIEIILDLETKSCVFPLFIQTQYQIDILKESKNSIKSILTKEQYEQNCFKVVE